MAGLTRILSIDGGGIRGVVSAQVLVRLEQILQQESGRTDARLAEFFDLIAGTSSGGILTCLFLRPDADAPTRPRFSAEQAAQFYQQRGGAIFTRSLWQKIRSLGGLRDEKHDAEALEQTLREYLADTLLSDLVKPCLIPAYDIERRQTKFFTQPVAGNQAEEFKARAVARATSAAPTFFETAQIFSGTDTQYALIDGGMFANNPALCAYAEVRSKFDDNPKAREMAILSIGSGTQEEKYTYEKARNWGLIGWALPVIQIMMSGVAETVDYQLQQIYDAVERPGQYLRVNGELGDISDALDDGSEAHIEELKILGESIADTHEVELREFALQHLIA